MNKLSNLKYLLDRLTKAKSRRIGASLRDAKHIVELSFGLGTLSEIKTDGADIDKLFFYNNTNSIKNDKTD